MPRSKYNYFILNISLLLKNLAKFYYYVGSFLLLLLIIIFIGAYIISFFDNKQFVDSLYLSLITATTIGYGDITPVSYASKIVAVILGFIGITFTGVVVAVTIEAIRLTLKEQLSPEELSKLENWIVSRNQKSYKSR